MSMGGLCGLTRVCACVGMRVQSCVANQNFKNKIDNYGINLALFTVSALGVVEMHTSVSGSSAQ